MGRLSVSWRWSWVVHTKGIHAAVLDQVRIRDCVEQVGVHCVVEVCIHIVIKPVSVGVSIWLAGARSVVLLLTIGSGVLGGSHSRCACVAS